MISAAERPREVRLKARTLHTERGGLANNARVQACRRELRRFRVRQDESQDTSGR